MDDDRQLIILLSSSSDASDEDECFLIEHVCEGITCRCHYRIRIPRIENYVETVVDRYNEQDFRRAFRLIIFPNITSNTSIFAQDRPKFKGFFVAPYAVRAISLQFRIYFSR